MVVIIERQEVGYINNAAIYKMTKALVLPVPRQCEYWSEEEVRYAALFVALRVVTMLSSCI